MTDPRRPSTLLSPARLTRFGVVVVIGMVAAVAVVVLTADGTTTITAGRLGGDWPAFRAAGVLAWRDPTLLLDADAQYAEMASSLGGSFAPFPYPPLFGLLSIPFGFVGFGLGYFLYVALLAAAGALAITWILELLDVEPAWRPVGLLGALTYAGTFLSVGGAQNATITLLVLAATFRLLDREQPNTAGLVASLLWFKPQFAIPVLGLLLVARHGRTVAVALAGGVGLWGLHGLVFGWDWHTAWFDLLALTDAGNRVFNTSNTISPVEWLRGVVEAPWGDVVGFGLALVLGAVFAWVARQRPHPADLLGLTALALVLTAPHALRYELALLVPALGVLVASRGVAFGLAAWLVAPVLVLPVPPVVRIAYVTTIATLYVRDLHPPWRLSGDRAEAGVGRAPPRRAAGNTITGGAQDLAMGDQA